MIEGACSLAITKSSLTNLEPYPIYFCTNYDPDTLINHHFVWCATALAKSVFPVPGGPHINTPFGCAIPNDSNIYGCFIGSSITYLI